MAREPRLVTKEDGAESPALLAGNDKTADDKVTYTPGPGDPLDVVWMGHKFKAHVPRPVRNAKLIEMAKTNKFFHVGEFDPARHAYKETVAEPKTAEAYRAWAVNWLKELKSVDELCERWANEARMRNRLEVGFDDFHYMSHLFQPKLDALLAREEEPRRKRDEIIRNRELDGLILQVGGIGQSAA